MYTATSSHGSMAADNTLPPLSTYGRSGGGGGSSSGSNTRCVPLRTRLCMRRTAPSAAYFGDDAHTRAAFAIYTACDTSTLRRTLASLRDTVDAGDGGGKATRRDTLAHDHACRSAFAPRSLYDVSDTVLLHCATFCDVATLLSLCRSGARMRRLLLSCDAQPLWAAAYARVCGGTAHSNGSARDVCDARVALMRVLARQRAARAAEVNYWETEYAMLQQRMAVRVAESKAQQAAVVGSSSSVIGNVFREDSSNARQNVVTDTSATPQCATFASALRQARARRVRVDGDTHTQPQDTPQQTVQLQQLQDEVRTLRHTCTTLAQQLQQCRSELDAYRAPHTHTHTHDSDAAITYADVIAFEQRMVRLVLHGCDNDKKVRGGSTDEGDTSDGHDSSSSVMHTPQLPAVLRRGVTDLPSLHMLCQVCGRLSGNEGEAPCAHAMRAVCARYAALTRTCAFDDAYYNLRDMLARTPRRTGADVAATPTSATSARVIAMLHRIQAMSDAEVVSTFMY